PRSFVGMAAIAFLGAVHKGVGSIRIRIKFMGLMKLAERGVEFRHVFGRRIAVISAKMTLQRAMNFGATLERRCHVTSPSTKRIPGIIRDRRFERQCGGRHQIHYSPAHTEADDADPLAVDGIVTLQEACRGIDVADDAPIAQTGSSSYD